jgi:hypothetical protein
VAEEEVSRTYFSITEDETFPAVDTKYEHAHRVGIHPNAKGMWAFLLKSLEVNAWTLVNICCKR